MTYGGNGVKWEKFKKIELNSEIWGEWGVTYGENGVKWEKLPRERTPPCVGANRSVVLRKLSKRAHSVLELAAPLGPPLGPPLCPPLCPPPTTRSRAARATRCRPPLVLLLLKALAVQMRPFEPWAEAKKNQNKR